MRIIRSCPNCHRKLDIQHMVYACPFCGCAIIDEEGYGGLVI